MMGTFCSFSLAPSAASVCLYFTQSGPFRDFDCHPGYFVKMDFITSMFYFSFLGLSQLLTPGHCGLLR